MPHGVAWSECSGNTIFVRDISFIVVRPSPVDND